MILYIYIILVVSIIFHYFYFFFPRLCRGLRRHVQYWFNEVYTTVQEKKSRRVSFCRVIIRYSIFIIIRVLYIGSSGGVFFLPQFWIGYKHNFITLRYRTSTTIQNIIIRYQICVF